MGIGTACFMSKHLCNGDFSFPTQITIMTKYARFMTGHILMHLIMMLEHIFFSTQTREEKKTE